MGLVDEEYLRRPEAMTVDDADELSPEDKLAVSKETIFLKEYDYSSLEAKQDLHTAYRYLYWACYRGHIHVANFILHKCRISPFLVDPSTQKSPFMASLEGNQYLMAKLLLQKDFRIQEKPDLIEAQKNAVDRFGNNPLHKAFRFRNPELVALLLKKKVGRLTVRNRMGRLPLEIPHNNILSDKKLKEAVFANVPAHEIAAHDSI